MSDAEKANKRAAKRARKFAEKAQGRLGDIGKYTGRLAVATDPDDLRHDLSKVVKHSAELLRDAIEGTSDEDIREYAGAIRALLSRGAFDAMDVSSPEGLFSFMSGLQGSPPN